MDASTRFESQSDSRSGFRQRLALGAFAAAVVRQHEVGNARCDLGAKAGAVEHAIMADARLQIVHFVFVRDVDAQALRGLRLPDARNIVVLALDREKRDTPDLR